MIPNRVPETVLAVHLTSQYTGLSPTSCSYIVFSSVLFSLPVSLSTHSRSILRVAKRVQNMQIDPMFSQHDTLVFSASTLFVNNIMVLTSDQNG